MNSITVFFLAVQTTSSMMRGYFLFK